MRLSRVSTKLNVSRGAACMELVDQGRCEMPTTRCNLDKVRYWTLLSDNRGVFVTKHHIKLFHPLSSQRSIMKNSRISGFVA